MGRFGQFNLHKVVSFTDFAQQKQPGIMMLYQFLNY
jgi:hypothetical protein